ncbi:endonuclease/exonuclease/phosphatase family protein [Hellea sp.]|nr:endonuclease/exonuclease/phosphatase family protein [Hellea sp.]
MPLKILSYNIQAAIGTKAYRQYVTRINRQVFNSKVKTKTLTDIAKFISDYDIACLQEVDLGGRRSGFKCQVDYLLGLSDFTHMSMQENRIIGNISRHGNAILSKHPQSNIRDLKLPGKRMGRGAVISRIDAPKPVYVLNVHLSLGEADQMTQIEYLAREVPSDVPLIIAGDFNCTATSRPITALAAALGMTSLMTPKDKTYPSWKPRKDFDHMLVSSHFMAHDTGAVDVRHSDHRPIKASLNY